MRLPFRGLKILCLSLVFACSRGTGPAGSPVPAEAQLADGGNPLSVAPIAGQPVSVLPITLVLADSAMSTSTSYDGYRDRRAALQRTDSLIAEAMQARAPEVHWILPPELRKMARRAPGMLSDPDQMGQALMRAPRLTKLPDPLRSELRSLVAIAGGRLVFIPAALGFTRDAAGNVHATLSLVLADARTGNVVWRSLTTATGATPDAALAAALVTTLPVE